MVRIVADIEMMSQTATRMQQQAHELESALGQLSAASGRLNYWEGASYSQFTAMWQQATAQMRTIAQQGQHLGQCLQTTADNFRNTDEQQANWSAGTAASQYPLKPKIEVKIHPLAGPSWSLNPLWHSYILYTDSEGKQHILQGNPEHGFDPNPLHFGMGKLTMYPADHEDGPGTTIWTYPGTDPAQAYKLMKDEADRIQASDTPYVPFVTSYSDPIFGGPFPPAADCHTATHMMIQAAGFEFQPDVPPGHPFLAGWNSQEVENHIRDKEEQSHAHSDGHFHWPKLIA